MAKKQMNKKDVLNGRFSILFFYSLLMCLFLWAERTARYRYDYVFRLMLPWVMPILLVLCIGGFVYLVLLAGRKKDAMERLFSPAFGAYLLVAPIMGLFLPLLSYFGVGLQLFKLATEAAFYLLIGHFIAYLAYYLIKPVMGLLGWLIALQSALGVYFYERQLSPATGILNAPEFGYLSAPVSALITGVLISFVALGAFWLGKVERFKLKPLLILVPTGLWELFLLVHVLFSFSYTVRLILLLSVVGIQVLFFGTFCVLYRKKK